MRNGPSERPKELDVDHLSQQSTTIRSPSDNVSLGFGRGGVFDRFIL